MTETPTPAERDAFLWLQGRMVELLLRHDAQRFGATFAEQQADMFADERLRHYRELAVLFYLRDELFSVILPRIKRRLSVAAPREMQTEDLPPRGRIDWSRTIADGLRARPGEPPLTVTTRQRRRHFTTPENLLTVVTLLEYRIAVQRVLDDEIVHNQAQALRHPLQDIVTSCTRELAFPPFAGLVRDSTAIISGHASQTVEELVAAVEANLLPGRTSAYDDLLAWRRKLAQLQLLDRTQTEALPMLGSDPARDNYLYQMWLFYELGDLLQQAGRLVAWDVTGMRLTFTWGDGEDTCTYELQHDQGIAQHWHDAPGVRPDLYIVQTDRQEVKDGDTLIWREPGYVLDAKYYRPRPSSKAPGDPVKRMIADLHLTGERHGALLFAFQGGPEPQQSDEKADGTTDEPDVDTMTQTHKPLYKVMPNATGGQTTTPDVQVGVWRVQPVIDTSSQQVRHILHSLLDHVHQTLRERVEARCRGVFLDSLGATAHGALAAARDLMLRDGAAITETLDDLLLCPKPHVGPWRVDLVSLHHDCCTNPHRCHILHHDGAQKPQRLTRLEDVADAIRSVVSGDDKDAQIAVATRQVLAVTQRYADLVQPDISHYRHWVRSNLDVGDLFDTTPLLTDAQRDTLALARFLWEQIEHIRATNFAAPTLLFTGVLEEITHITLYAHCRPLCNAQTGQPLQRTLGTLGHCKGHGGANWALLEADIVHGQHWNEQIAPQQTLSLSSWVDMIWKLSKIRNDAAHRANVGQKAFQSLTQLYFGGDMSGSGVMNGLLLAWRG
jgi:hypothetical protein